MVVMFTGIGFVALLTAFGADRFIRTAPGPGRTEDPVLTKLETIEERLNRLERGAFGG
jgi:hypothetical protein